MSDQPQTAVGSTPRPRPQWKRWLPVAAVAALAGRLLLHLLTSGPSYPWPPKLGEDMHIRAGDPAVLQWDADPDHVGFVVTSLERYRARLPKPIPCGMMPGIMAASGGVGATLTAISHDAAGWTAFWEGMPTMDVEQPDSGKLSSCGRIALVRMSDQQLHDFTDILNGLPVPQRDPVPSE